ncbi:uncharacterized protein LOC104907813 isoform X2 [Beta vulgaris subsp. vulgaris]|nr:uncharacterized protein LOC104907813 isoform X2 [Beta vulgaris subsp. vulgaris]
MAFHVACPITCKRICFCTLGFPPKLHNNGGKCDFVGEISQLQEFLKDPWIIRVKEGATIQIPVPKVVPPPPPPFVSAVVDGDDAAAAAAEELLSAQTKRVALQKKAAVASMAAEDFARRFESGVLVDANKDLGVEEHGSSNVNVMCRLCFSGENEGSERARKMLPCSTCGKKYHRSCLKTWSQHRDLFHWSSWTCPSCRACEVCRRTGEPNKFKFCKRCDGAFHCYCMQPPHKNVSSGPYLCPKHTKCHSCGSNVPGNGLSVRWFLGYTCCDACGRLFTKGNYCPACLKVYRDSEATPMVCCDICQRWVHIQCDGISDERYLQFQIDGNLPYTCPTCRGECYQVRDLEDAVQELWRRRDEADRDLIASLRAAAGLPTQEDIFSISPFSDDEDNGPSAGKGEHSRARFSLKNLTDFSPKKIKESGKKTSSKKYVKKKGYQMSLDGKMDVKREDYNESQLSGSRLGDIKEATNPHGLELFSSHVSGSLSPTGRTRSHNEQGVLRHKFMDEVAGNNSDRRATMLQIKNKKINDTGATEDVGQVASKPKTIKGTKLVIHLGGRNKTITNSPKSDSSSYQREQELATLSGGNEAVSQHRTGDYLMERLDGTSHSDDGYKVDGAHEIRGKPRDRNIIKLGKGKSEVSGPQSHKGNGLFGLERTHIMSSKRSNEASAATEGLSMGEKISLRKHPENRQDITGDSNKSNQPASPALDASLKDSRPLLRLKFKTPYPSSWVPNSEEERGSVKGQRSKRKRPSPLIEKPKHHEQEDVTESQDDNLMNEIMDASWILKKLGKDAMGKRVEVHQPSDNS